jgi:hypothetical protein
MFTNRNNTKTINLTINNTRIEEKRNTKLLGITFTNRLSLTDHYKITKTKIQKTINILKTLTHTLGGTHPETMINIYKAIINSKLEYPYTITDTKNKTILKICQTIKNSSIRICLGLTKTTPIPVLLAESTETTTELDNDKKTLKYIIKQLHRNTKIGNDIKNQSSLPKLNFLYIKYPSLAQIKPIHYKHTCPNNLKIYPYKTGITKKNRQ